MAQPQNVQITGGPVCPCGAYFGQPCRTKTGGKAKKHHSARVGGPSRPVKKTQTPPLTLVTDTVGLYKRPPIPQRVTEPKVLVDTDRYRRATFNFARACKEVFESQKYAGSGVAKTAVQDLQYGLEFVSKFIVPNVRGSSPFNDN